MTALRPRRTRRCVGARVAIDVDDATLTFRVSTGPLHGALVVPATVAFTYTPTLNYFGADGFTYVANDGV